MYHLTRKQRCELLSKMAARGSTSDLQVLLSNIRLALMPTELQELLQAAAKAGRLDTCSWLLKYGCKVGVPALKVAAGEGHKPVCKLFLAQSFNLRSEDVRAAFAQHCFDRNTGLREAAISAARGGHPVLAESLLQRYMRFSYINRDPFVVFGGPNCSIFLVAAAEGCNLETMRVFYARCVAAVDQPPAWRTTGWVRRMQEAAARSPTPDWRAKIECLEAAFHVPRDPAVAAAAASRPDAIARLEWLRQRGYPTDGSAAVAAAAAGNTAALEYLLTVAGVRFRDADAAAIGEAAARAGNLEALKLLRTHGCAMVYDGIVFEAVRGGHLPVLMWAVDAMGADIEADGWATQLLSLAMAKSSAALGAGHGAPMLAWLRKRGGAWGADAFEVAVKGGASEAVLEWMAADGCPIPAGAEPYRWAAERGDLVTLRCLRRLGCPWDDPSPPPPSDDAADDPDGSVPTCPPTLPAASSLFAECLRYPWKPLPVLRCLAEELGCPVDWEAALEATKAVEGPPERRCPREVREWVAAQWRRAAPPPPRSWEHKQRTRGAQAAGGKATQQYRDWARGERQRRTRQERAERRARKAVEEEDG